MPLIALARLYGHRLRRGQRVTYIDWTGPLMQAAAQLGWRVLYLGSKPGVAERGASILRRRYHGLQIETINGYFDADPDSADNDRVLKSIEDYRPQLLMVGMGMPRQEYWIQDNFGRISANVILPSGAAIDYVADAVPTPPRWAGQLGLEWAFRLATEPGRLWRRYLLEPWFVLRVVANDLLRRRFKIGVSPLSEEE
jgi:N-acetylglucosaminyldiphosphoundecaprenol N-acetyl-beta-D-mannosaminyltransferase